MSSTILLIGVICLASLCAPLNGLPNNQPILSSELVELHCNTNEHCLKIFGKNTNHTECKDNSCQCFDSENHRVTCKPDVRPLKYSNPIFFFRN